MLFYKIIRNWLFCFDISHLDSKINLVAAIILVVIVVGLTATLNQLRLAPKPVKFYDLSENFETEAVQVIDWGIYNREEQEEIEDKLANFSKDFAEYAREKQPNLGLLYIYGNESGVDIVNLMAEEAEVKTTGENKTLLGGGGISLSRLTVEIGGEQFVRGMKTRVTEYGLSRASVKGKWVTVRIGGLFYDFQLGRNQNFYMITITNTSGEEKHVEIGGPGLPGGEQICYDGINNDLDGWTDCQDIDCTNNKKLGAIIGEKGCVRDYKSEYGHKGCACYNNEYSLTEFINGVNVVVGCSDGFDNDANGKFDCFGTGRDVSSSDYDQDCIGKIIAAPGEVIKVRYKSNHQSDYPNWNNNCKKTGPGSIFWECNQTCILNSGCMCLSVESGPNACRDGIDNDGDGLVDTDPECGGRIAPSKVKVILKKPDNNKCLKADADCFPILGCNRKENIEFKCETEPTDVELSCVKLHVWNKRDGVEVKNCGGGGYAYCVPNEQVASGSKYKGYKYHWSSIILDKGTYEWNCEFKDGCGEDFNNSYWASQNRTLKIKSSC